MELIGGDVVKNKFLLLFIEVKEFIDIFFGYKVMRAAAAVSYYITLSFFPFLICLNWLIATIGIDVGTIVNLTAGFIPQPAMDSLNQYLEYITDQQSPFLLITGVTFLATSASAAFRTLVTIMEEIHGRQRFSGVVKYLLSFAGSTMFLFSVYFFMLFSVVAKSIISLIDKWLHTELSMLFQYEWMHSFLILVFLTVILYCLYKTYNRKGKAFKALVLSSVISAVLLVVVSYGFSELMRFSVKYSLVYGSLTSVICLMMWIFICANIIIGGSVLGRVIGYHCEEEEEAERKALEEDFLHSLDKKVKSEYLKHGAVKRRYKDLQDKIQEIKPSKDKNNK